MSIFYAWAMDVICHVCFKSIVVLSNSALTSICDSYTDSETKKALSSLSTP